jgi:hypothetical protein
MAANDPTNLDPHRMEAVRVFIGQLGDVFKSIDDKLSARLGSPSRNKRQGRDW